MPNSDSGKSGPSLLSFAAKLARLAKLPIESGKNVKWFPKMQSCFKDSKSPMSSGNEVKKFRCSQRASQVASPGRPAGKV